MRRSGRRTGQCKRASGERERSGQTAHDVVSTGMRSPIENPFLERITLLAGAVPERDLRAELPRIRPAELRGEKVGWIDITT